MYWHLLELGNPVHASPGFFTDLKFHGDSKTFPETFDDVAEFPIKKINFHVISVKPSDQKVLKSSVVKII